MKLADCTKQEKRYLHRFVCGLCGFRLDRESCGAIFERCSQQARDKRRADCLQHYKSRTPKRHGAS